MSFYKNKKILFFFVVLICILMGTYTIDRAYPSLIENSIGNILMPIQKFNTGLYNWLSDKYNIFVNMKEIQEENEILKIELAKKNELIGKFAQLEAENKLFSQLLETSSKYSNFDKIAANIIAKDPGNWYESFTIDKGSNDGIEKDMAVIANGGLVGKVIVVGKTYSTVVSIVDSSDAVSSKSLRTNDIGFVRGNLSKKGTCVMEYINNDAEIIEGDEITTSHLSQIYPPGITIGYVSEIIHDKNSLTKTAIINPVVDFKYLETILVVKNKSENYIKKQTTNIE